MKQQEIDRINELSRLSRERELTQEEQAALSHRLSTRCADLFINFSTRPTA